MEKVWIYLSDKPVEGELKQQITDAGNAFVMNWKAHDVPLSASFDIVHDRFLVVRVDETQYNASGCSIDKLLRLVKQLEADHGLQLLNRLLVAYDCEEGIKVSHASDFKALLQKGDITSETLVYDTAASDSVQYAVWKKPLKDTWLKKYL